MPAAPLFRRGDTVYLKSSSAVGRLDSFKVGNSRILNGKWVYQIGISKKPPHQQTIGDSWDKRVLEGDLFYYEDELITMCEAIDLGINELNKQIASVQVKQIGVCDNVTEPVAPDYDPDGPRFAIGELVYLDVSARLGFFMSAKITGTFETGVQPGSPKTKYVYTTDLKHTTGNMTIYHREDEFITVCEACPKVLANLNGQLANLVAKRDDLCSGI
jgi:hypothetical protein